MCMYKYFILQPCGHLYIMRMQSVSIKSKEALVAILHACACPCPPLTVHITSRGGILRSTHITKRAGMLSCFLGELIWKDIGLSAKSNSLIKY